MSRNPRRVQRAEYVLSSNMDTRISQPAQRKARAISERSGGARRDRTDDLKLAKLPLSQLSYGPFRFAPKDGLEREQTCPTPTEPRKEWWAWEDLNFRPHAYQARALTN